MIRSILAAALGAAALVAAPLAAQAQSAKPTLSFTAIPDEDATKLVERFGKVAKYLEAKLGVPVTYVPVKSYPASVTAFKNGQVQLAWFGGLTSVQARLAVPGSQSIVQGAEDTAFVSYIIANAATGLEPGATFPKAAKGKSFTFGAKTSTSGRLMPEFYIRKETGEAPEKFFSRVGFSGDHTKTVELVASGAYEVGAVNYTSFDDMVAAGKVDPKVVKILWKTPSFPDYNFTIRGDVDKTFGPGFIDKVKAALLAIDDPEILKAFPRSKFVPATNADYAPIEETAKELQLLD